MKKSLIALAVLAASGAAMAQSSVQVYGLADVWFGTTKATLNGVGASETVLNGGGVNTSRIGFKGTEDLGGGLKANFVIETAIGIDAPGPTTLGDRNAFVGLSGNFGAVQLGKSWSSYDDIRSGANDNFGANVAASFNTWVPYNDRPNNSIKYVSPEVAGFSGSVTYGLGEDKNLNANNKASSVFSLGVQYANGPVFVGFAHQTEKAGAGTALGALAPLNTAIVAAGGVAVVAPAGAKASYNLLNGSYDFGVAKLVAGYNQVKYTEPGVAGDLKANEYLIGVEVPVAANLNAGLGYAQSKLKANGVSFAKSSGYTATILYSLSKRTTVYGALAKAKTVDTVGAGFEAKVSTYGVGINHKF